MDALAEATARAIGKVHKTRLSVEERETPLAERALADSPFADFTVRRGEG
ncbi:hypothetical protein BH10PSE4_BH10PSE4_17130 [soil metagenome]